MDRVPVEYNVDLLDKFLPIQESGRREQYCRELLGQDSSFRWLRGHSRWPDELADWCTEHDMYSPLVSGGPSDVQATGAGRRPRLAIHHEGTVEGETSHQGGEGWRGTG